MTTNNKKGNQLVTENIEWEVASVIHDSWDALINNFLGLTQFANEYFENRKFKELFDIAVQRYHLYGAMVKDSYAIIEPLLGDKIHDTQTWQKIKYYYSHLIQNRYDKPNTETFYNSISRKVFNQVNIGFSEQFEFFNNEDYHIVEFTEPKIYREITVHKLSADVIKDLLLSLNFKVQWEDIDRDSKAIMDFLTPIIVFQKNNIFLESIELVNPIFYRNRGAFVVGKLRYRRWVMPFVIAILNEDKGLFVDAFVTNPSDISILFSFTRSSFMVSTQKPVELIDYLKTIMPFKPMSELYDAIGYFRNGKTTMYRDLMNYVRNHEDKFIIAPGIKGMVMCVFTLTNYPFVFKIIKDKFDNPKNVTRDQVVKKYQEVELNDRVGRMAYAHQFEHLRFPRSYFSEELIEEFQLVATKSVVITEEHVTILHCYMERKMEPLNLYLEKASVVETCKAMLDYGNCIKELAKANIFPGDLLLKNFGVTRHGRVIFYDYDEICSVTECRFRRLPEPIEGEEMFHHESAFSVEHHDIFPEEFKNFMVPDGPLGDLFMQEHSDLFSSKYWRQIQRNIAKGEYMKFYAYSKSSRFLAHRADEDI
ncbi:MAG: bifunctional isocitrate dehydrogenase kinase/phosphatase [Chitinophagales bacterium]|nr:bifunctional isocitrate dehydrogenase kinase/phosphatase [Chitinophagales bacterium]